QGQQDHAGPLVFDCGEGIWRISMPHFITEQTKIDDALLKLLAYLPTEHLTHVADLSLFKRFGHRDFMRLATFLAAKSYEEGGCPIGAVIVDRDDQRILGKGHNLLGQENDTTTHGETAAIRDAGRVARLQGQDVVDFRKTVLYTSLTP